jgi:hypothetical protein
VSGRDSACGFYWTDGHRGLGWAVNAIPPLKGGSGLAIPSPPQNATASSSRSSRTQNGFKDSKQVGRRRPNHEETAIVMGGVWWVMPSACRSPVSVVFGAQALAACG